MRERDPKAIAEFFARFSGGLGELARLYRIPPSEREHCVVEFLNDVALEFIESARPIPRKLPAYLATAFRHRRQNEARADGRAERRRGAATCAAEASGEPVVYTVCSEDAVRTSRGPAWEAAPRSPVLERLAAFVEKGLSPEERLVLAWVSNAIPLRQIAEWLGIDRSAAKVRVWRLRARLARAARAYASALDPTERAETERFFRRAAPPGAAGISTTGVRDEQPARTAAQRGGHTATRSRCNEGA
jgi:hypothetical protein